MTHAEEARCGEQISLSLVPQIAEITRGVPQKYDVVEKRVRIDCQIDLRIEHLPAERVRHESRQGEREGAGQPPP